MSTYLVRWEIHISADSPKEAAKKALEIHRDPASISTVFEVFNDQGVLEEEVDLNQ